MCGVHAVSYFTHPTIFVCLQWRLPTTAYLSMYYFFTDLQKKICQRVTYYPCQRMLHTLKFHDVLHLFLRSSRCHDDRGSLLYYILLTGLFLSGSKVNVFVFEGRGQGHHETSTCATFFCMGSKLPGLLVCPTQWQCNYLNHCICSLSNILH